MAEAQAAKSGKEAFRPQLGGDDLSTFDVSLKTVFRVYLYFFRFIIPVLPAFLLVTGLMLVQIPVGQLSQFLIRDVVDQALLAIDRTRQDRTAHLIQLMLLQSGFWLLGDLLWKFREICNWYTFMRGTLYLRLYFFRHLHQLPMGFLRRRPPGEHLYRSTSDIMSNHNDPFDAGMMGMVAWTVLPVVETVYTLSWASFFLYMVDPTLAFLVAAYAVPFTLTAHLMVGFQRKAFVQAHFAHSNEVSVYRDSIGGLRALKCMGKALYQRHRFTQATANARKRSLWYVFLQILSNDGAIWLVRFSFTTGLVVYMAYRVVNGQSTLGEFVAVPLIVESARGPIERLVGALQSIRIWTVNGQRIMQTLGVNPTLTDPPGARKMPPVQGAIRFENVTLAYEEDGAKALDGVTLEVQPGQSIGLVGPSGAGKSTLLNVLLRLYAPDQGRVTVDGVDISGIKLDSLLEQMAVVPQQTFLYDGSIRENIQFGKARATDEEILDAMEQAEAISILERHAEGLDYEVGDATTISGGERQRLGIARALVRNPRIFLLDEATANLDPQNEDEIVRTLERVTADRTVLVVAHRLKAVARCDRIVVLERGRIADEGTHEELLSRPGWYRDVWIEQQGGGA